MRLGRANAYRQSASCAASANPLAKRDARQARSPPSSAGAWRKPSKAAGSACIALRGIDLEDHAGRDHAAGRPVGLRQDDVDFDSRRPARSLGGIGARAGKRPVDAATTTISSISALAISASSSSSTTCCRP